LMAKYVLTSAQLSKAIDGLIHSKALGPGEIKENFLSSAVQVSPENLREVERCYLDFELPIVDTGPPEIDGMVRNLTEKGVGIVGIPSRVGESKTFLVLHDEFVLIEPFMFEAQCRWATRNDPGGEFVSGFEITDISEKDLGELQKLIHLVTFYA
ncbi:MAG: PilZ domain-containing protein, partial [Deltaproteobacteria bacterium]|nr:PilZ domain-containing protein [Deltaproteobacteria bacterium]